MIFIFFSKTLTIKKQKKRESSLSHKVFHCFEPLASTNAHDCSIEILKGIHGKRTCEKHVFPESYLKRTK